MGAQLAATRGEQVQAAPPRTVTVLGLDRAAPVAEVADSIAAGLRKFGSVALLREGELATIEQAERDADRVVMCAGPGPATTATSGPTCASPRPTSWSR